jgi:hypothetical protein
MTVMQSTDRYAAVDLALRELRQSPNTVDLVMFPRDNDY